MTIPTPTVQITCSRCETNLDSGARFCSSCGTAVGDAVRAQPRTSREFLLERIRHVTDGEFEIISELGRGGMATVYLAHDAPLDRKVAIKVMSPDLYVQGDNAERFKREARTAAGLSHPHIIPIYSVRENDDLLFFVMKYVEGRPLDDIIEKGGALPIPIATAILNQVGSALAFAHRNGIVHRDIKPANILIDEDGWAMVTDFGIAKVAQTRGLTMTGGTVGTPTYMSPEQCVGGEITGASDQYSLGIVAYQMLVGKLPYRADTVMSSMWAHVNEPPQPLEQARPECPRAMALAIMRMLEKQPEKRWGEVAEAIEAMGPVDEQDSPTRESMVELATSEFGSLTPVVKKRVSAAVRAADTMQTDTVNEPVATLTVNPPAGKISVGDQLQLKATARSAGGAELSNRKVLWSVSSPGIVSMTTSGLVTGVGEGKTTIKATCDGAIDVCTVTVSPVPVGEVTVTPSSRSIRMMESFQATADLADTAGNPLPARKVNWASSDAAIAEVTDGRVVGIRPGRVSIAATIDGARGVCTVDVTAIPMDKLVVEPREANIGTGESIQLKGEPVDERGMPLGDRKVQWASSDPSIVTVSSTGVVEGVKVGQATVTAACDEIVESVAVTVMQVPLAALVAEPSRGAMAVEQRLQFVAEPQDASGRVLTDRRVTWHSVDPEVVEMSSTGLAYAAASGTTFVVAQCEELEARVRVTVTRVGAATVETSSPVRNLEVGESAQLRVKTFDQFGKSLSGRFVQWTSSDPEIARVTSSGKIIARFPGSVTITASSDARSDELKINIKPPAFARVRIQPEGCAIPEGWQRQFSAVTLSPNGDVVSEIECVWAVSDPAIATISPNGVLTTHAPGSVMIAATADGKRATERIVVTELPKDD